MSNKWDSGAKQEQAQGSGNGKSWSRSSSGARSSGSSGGPADGIWAAFVRWLKRILGE